MDPLGLYSLLRPLLFRLPPERAQALAERVLRIRPVWDILARTLIPSDPELRTNLASIPLRSPIGLAAGWDKNCELLRPLANLGFGYVIGGTVTRLPQPGNPRPRLIRLPKERALINSLGFPSKGLSHVEAQLQSLSPNLAPIFVSITGLTEGDFLECHNRLEPFVSGVELNISSPNTSGIWIFQDPNRFGRLVDRLNKNRSKLLMVKLPTYNSSTRETILALIQRGLNLGVNGFTVANARPVNEARVKVGRGGLSGGPLLPDTLAMISDIRHEAGHDLIINACGGISTGMDAFHALQAGANTVQILTGLVYQGPGVVSSINKALTDLCQERGLASVTQI